MRSKLAPVATWPPIPKPDDDPPTPPPNDDQEQTMAARTKYGPPTPKQLAQDEWNIDHAGGRRHCPVHRDQQMIPLVPGMDRCPLPHGADGTSI